MAKTKKLENFTKEELVDKLVEVGVATDDNKSDFESLKNETLISLIDQKEEVPGTENQVKEYEKKISELESEKAELSEMLKNNESKNEKNTDNVVKEATSDLVVENRKLKQKFNALKSKVTSMAKSFEKEISQS